ncbi:MAG: hypothetical protein JNL72_00965 [Flavipsychrobacter sp.]|nr:hypothetical protein [Flavipsychrobacter sp.]
MNKLLFFFLFAASAATAQTDSQKDSISADAKPSRWYEKVSIRGYVQARYNRLLETNEKLKCEQCDRSIGENGGFFLRRVRVIFFGQVHERVYFYIQPDFASSASSTGLHFGQIRDAYFDVGFNKKNTFRARIGQSKVPYGFENMQSSQNRLPLDRNDALNSAVSNERDLGVFLYWAPDKIRKRFASLVNDGLKGSGDYGVFAFGAFNGQTANKPELNNLPHIVARASYPFKVGKKQIIEPGIQAYTGKYTLASDLISKGTKVRPDFTYMDERVAGTFVLYPQPIGVTAEYNIGRGPEFNTATDSIETRNLTGGYIMVNAMLPWKKQLFFPFARAQYYNGGKKFELDARSYTVNEYEVGVEWQPMKNFEFVAMYTISRRRFEDFVKQNNVQAGRLLRLQAQLNF